MPTKYINKEDLAEQAAQCYEYRLKGKNLREIAKLVGLSPATVMKRLKIAREDRLSPLAEEYRQELIDRLERKLDQAEDMRDNDKLSLDQKLKIDEQIRKYNADLYEVTGLKNYKIEFKDVTDAPVTTTENVIAFYEKLLGFEDKSIINEDVNAD